MTGSGGTRNRQEEAHAVWQALAAAPAADRWWRRRHGRLRQRQLGRRRPRSIAAAPPPAGPPAPPWHQARGRSQAWSLGHAPRPRCGPAAPVPCMEASPPGLVASVVALVCPRQTKALDPRPRPSPAACPGPAAQASPCHLSRHSRTLTHPDARDSATVAGPARGPGSVTGPRASGRGRNMNRALLQFWMGPDRPPAGRPPGAGGGVAAGAGSRDATGVLTAPPPIPLRSAQGPEVNNRRPVEWGSRLGSRLDPPRGRGAAVQVQELVRHAVAASGWADCGPTTTGPPAVAASAHQGGPGPSAPTTLPARTRRLEAARRLGEPSRGSPRRRASSPPGAATSRTGPAAPPRPAVPSECRRAVPPLPCGQRP